MLCYNKNNNIIWRLKMKNSTIDYYNTNAEKFVNDTVNVEFTDIQDKFISKLC